jgi:hypothetical protein
MLEILLRIRYIHQSGIKIIDLRRGRRLPGCLNISLKAIRAINSRAASFGIGGRTRKYPEFFAVYIQTIVITINHYSNF